ncbi:MAG TPA: DedA family protein [Treponema sp.]|nr:DedA family protein [Treponema sp.]
MELPAFLYTLPDEIIVFGFFFFLLIYSFSLPITEEVALLLVGLLAQARGCNFLVIVLVSYPGIFGSDIVYYVVAKYFGFRLLSSKFFSKLIKPKKVLASEMYFKRRGPRIAFFCRFLVGIRAPIMIAAGILRMPFKTFALYDGLAAVISTFFWLFAGYYFGSLLEQGLHTLVFIFSVITPLLLIAGFFIINHKISREEKLIDQQTSKEEHFFNEASSDMTAYGN